MRRMILAAGMAAGLALAVGVATAQRLVVEGQKKAEYPLDWGDNVLATEGGAQIVEQSPAEKPENDARNLIDGDVSPDEPYWSVRPSIGGSPNPFVVFRWEKMRTVDRVAFFNDLRGRNVSTKDVRVSFSEDGQQYTKPQSFSLRQEAKVLSFEVSPPQRGRFLRLEVAGNYGGPFAVMEEFAAFEGRASRASLYRGTAAYDIMELKNGDVLTGLVQNETIEIQTSYARLVFSQETIANIVFEGSASALERITMINGDTFSGFILTRILHFVLQNKQTVDIRKDKVNRLGFRLRTGERRFHPPSDVIFLRNGDIFNGKVLNPSLTIKTAYATLTNQMAEIARIDFTGDSKIVTKITLRNQNTMQGLLEEEDIEIELDSGPKVTVYKDKIDRIEMRRG